MARPERKNADYFPFYAKDGRTLFILESKYQCKGTGFFTNVMRFLTLQDDHYFCIADESDKLYFFSKCKCDIESGMDMLNIMAKTGKIHGELWVSYQVIVSQDLLKSLTDAYKNRKNGIISIEEILVSYQESTVTYPKNTQGSGITSPGNPQSKVKESKVKESKVKSRVKRFTPPSVNDVAQYCTERNNNVDAVKFVDFYASKGWMIGKNKMKDWKAAVRTWESRDGTLNNKSSPLSPKGQKNAERIGRWIHEE
jgi:hypothetical protein